MSQISFDQIVSLTLALPQQQRAELVALLQNANDGLPPGQDRTPEEWEAEIMRRSDALHAGELELVDADEAIAKVRAKLAAKSK